MRLPRLLLFALASAGLAGVFAACTPADEQIEPEGPVVARVDGHPIALADLEAAYARFASIASIPGADARIAQEVLDGLVMRRLVVQAAQDDGIAQTEDYQQAEAAAEKRALVGAYAARVLLDTLAISERDLAELFVQTQTTYEARHLYARTEAEAERLLARLDRGETFETLAREVFVDPRLAETGGYLGEFAHDEMDPALEEALFDMGPGEVRGPIRTAQGYSVVKLENKASHPMLTEAAYQKRRPRLKQYERRRRETAARYAAAAHFLEQAGLSYETGALQALAARWTGDAVLAPLRAEAADTDPIVRFTQNGRPVVWTASDLDRLADQADPAQRGAIQDVADVERFVEGLVVREAMADEARRRRFDQLPEARRYVAREMDDWTFEQAAAEARSGARPTDADLRAYFDADPAAYQHGPRVLVEEVLVETKAEADRVRADLRRGADLARLAAEQSIRPGAALTGGQLGAVSRSELGMLADPIFDAAPGDVLGPFEIAGRYAVLRRGADVAPAPMTFGEARPLLTGAVQREMADERFRDQIERLRSRYAVEIDSGVLRQANLSATPVLPGTPQTGATLPGVPLPL